MFRSIYVNMGLSGLLITVAFAWWKGGRAERMGAAMIAAIWLTVVAVQTAFTGLFPTALLFASDIVGGVGFLIIAIRYSSVWLGAAMLFEAGSFAAHAFQMADPDGPRWHGMRVYLMITNIMSDLILLTLVAGTIAAILRRRRAVRDKVEASTRVVKRPAWLPADPPPTVGTP